MSHIHFNIYKIAESILFLLKLTSFGGCRPKSGQAGKHRSLNNVEFFQVIRAVTAREGEAEFDSPETIKKRPGRLFEFLFLRPSLRFQRTAAGKSNHRCRVGLCNRELFSEAGFGPH